MSQRTHWDYGQFLLVSHVNYTQTDFADHHAQCSHDRINRLMGDNKRTPRELRQAVRKALVLSENGSILCDATVLDTSHSCAMELVRRQWRGNAKNVIKGIGVVTCGSVNPASDRFWVIDDRIDNPAHDGRSKLAHVLEMWRTLLHGAHLPCRTVLLDSWYATMKVMQAIDNAGNSSYCPLKANRHVTERPDAAYRRVDSLTWTDAERASGKMVHRKQFPQGHHVNLLRIVLVPQRTEYVVTHAPAQDSADATRQESAIRWKIEQFHREAKQVTGLESWHCRSQRAQRNHRACAMLVWVRLHARAQADQTNLYQRKQGLLRNDMREQLRQPSISMLPA